MYKRYGNPMELLRTYRLANLLDFILYLFETEREERVYNQWLHTNMQQSFKDFKAAQNYQSIRKKQKEKPVTKEEEKEMIDYALQFIKPSKSTGVMENDG